VGGPHTHILERRPGPLGEPLANESCLCSEGRDDAEAGWRHATLGDPCSYCVGLRPIQRATRAAAFGATVDLVPLETAGPVVGRVDSSEDGEPVAGTVPQSKQTMSQVVASRGFPRTETPIGSDAPQRVQRLGASAWEVLVVLIARSASPVHFGHRCLDLTVIGTVC
jgi:hypothetical protein